MQTERAGFDDASSDSSSSSLFFPAKDSFVVPVEEEHSGESFGNSADIPVPVTRSSYDDEEGDVCRICRNPEEDISHFSGSIKFVHQDCLLQWLKHSKARQCEVCKHPFSFSPVYAEGAPARLPFREFILGIGRKSCYVLKFLTRLSFVLTVWFLIIPDFTFLIWQLAFVRSFTEGNRLFISHMSTTVILTDCLHGFLVMASIGFITSLGAKFLLRYVEIGDRNWGRAVRRPPGQAIRNLAGDGNVIEVGEAQGIPDGAADVALVELVGMQGPVFHLLENAFRILVQHMILIAVVIFVPFSLGRIILHYISGLFSTTTNPVLFTVMPHSRSGLALVNITLKNALTAVADLSSENPAITLIDHAAETLEVNASMLDGAHSNISTPIASDILKGMTAGTSQFSDVTTLGVGYMFIFSSVFVYLSIVALRRIQGIASLVRQFLAAMRHLITTIKVPFLLVIEFGVYPLMCGWWLDVCTTRMFGNSMAQRVDFFSVSPLASSFLHWVVGIIYMLQINIFVSLLRGVLCTGVHYFLCGRADPNYFRDLIVDPVHKYARSVLLTVAVDGSLIVILFFLPVKLTMRMAPSVFPLDISISDPFTEGIPPDVLLLFQICIPFALKYFKTRIIVKSLLRYWFTTVGWALGLADFLLPGREDVVVQDNGEDEPHGPENNDITEKHDGQEQYDLERYSFVFRIVLLLVLAWMTLFVFNSALIVIPVSLGRIIFNGIPLLRITHGIECNDLYAFSIGSYVIWTVIAGVRYTVEQINSGRAAIRFGQIGKWCGIVLTSCALLSVWMFVIPVLIGLLFELLVLVPIRVPIDQSPVFLLYQDWVFGLIFLKLWTRFVTSERMIDETWKVKLERVRENGFSRLQGVWVVREILSPILMKLLTALCVPYVLARGIFPVFGYPLMANSAVYRFAWSGSACLIMLCLTARKFHIWLANLHNSIWNDRYLIGRRLHNYGESKLKNKCRVRV